MSRNHPTGLYCSSALLPEGWRRNVRLSFAAGCLCGVQADAVIQADDDRCAIAVPGLANLHSHAFQRALAGLAEHRGTNEDSFWTWREVMYRFLDRLTPEDVAAIAAQAFAEMLESGFTQVGEFHYLHHDPAGAPYDNPAEMAERVAEAAMWTGIGLTLLPCFYAHGGFGGAAPVPGQRRFIYDLDGFARAYDASRTVMAGLPDARLGLAPHSLRAVTPAELAQLLMLHPTGPIHIHAAEQMAEVAACIAATGQTPVRWLLDHAAIDARWCLVHATHMDAGETAALAASGAVAGLCPSTEANLGDGVFAARSYCGAGGRFGVGTDSNIFIDPAAELRQLEYSQRLRHQARNVLAGGPDRATGRTLFEAALAGGAQALGHASTGFTEGASADIVALDPNHPVLAGRSGDALLNGWLFAAVRPAVATVWRAGRCVVRDGRHIDAAAIRGGYTACLRRLLS